MSAPLVAAHNVCVEFAGREVLHDVSVAVQPGRVVTLIGPNGAGKSTLVRILLGLAAPTRGHVERRADLRIGYMPQSLTIDRDLPMTVRRFLQLSGVKDATRIATTLEEVGAAYVIDQAVQLLSGGEFQRVLLARALLRDPDLLVLDEPVRSVDVTGQAELYDLIGKMRQTHRCGVLMVSHDLHLVMAATDEVVCLNQHVCCAGTPETVGRHPEYFAMFGPTIAPSLAIYTHAHDHAHDTAGHVVDADGHTHRHDHEPHSHG